MTKEELAKFYAQEKVAELENLIEEAFIEGYNQGELSNKTNVVVDGFTFVDFNLPSGTLWSCAPQYFDYGWHLKLATYEEAKKYNIPTKKQWLELLDNCLVDGLHIIGPNGEKVGYPIADNSPSNRYTTYTLGEKCKKGRNKFWLCSEPDEKHYAEDIVFDEGDTEFDKHFIGCKLPYFVVKQKG